MNADETEIAPALTKLQASWGKKVALGSYPDWLSNYSKVRLVLDSESLEEVEKARIQLVEELPKGSVVTLVRDPVTIAPAEVYKLADDGEGYRSCKAGGLGDAGTKFCLTVVRLEGEEKKAST